jgi:hypothetical protein
MLKVPEMTPPTLRLVGCVGVVRHSTSLGYFGGGSQKPTWLHSNFDIISQVDQHRTTDLPKNPDVLARRTIGADGRPRYTGTSCLKMSQSYPRDFGVAVRKVYDANKRSIQRAATSRATSPVPPAEELLKIIGRNAGRDWLKGAALGEVVHYLLASV